MIVYVSSKQYWSQEYFIMIFDTAKDFPCWCIAFYAFAIEVSGDKFLFLIFLFMKLTSLICWVLFLSVENFSAINISSSLMSYF